MILAVDPKTFQNVSVLLHKEDEAIDLLHLPVDTVLLRWCNYHLKRVGSSKVMQSFSTDLKVGTHYLSCLSLDVTHNICRIVRFWGIFWSRCSVQTNK